MEPFMEHFNEDIVYGQKDTRIIGPMEIMEKRIRVLEGANADIYLQMVGLRQRIQALEEGHVARP